MKKIQFLSAIFFVALISLPLSAQIEPGKPGEKEIVMTVESEVSSTPVKNQSKTGTCWSYAMVSFLESELLRTKKTEFDLSEMYFVRLAYPQKAMYYVRLQGKAVFSEGGQAHDVLNIMRNFGAVPENVYPGIQYDEQLHNHNEMTAILQGMLLGITKNEGGRLTDRWPDAVNSVLDVYLGKIPEHFAYEGKEYTPVDFSNKVLKIDPDNYIELTSFSHHPFYTQFDLEIADNWAHSDYYNIPLDEMMQVIDNAIQEGYSICWDGDITGLEFSQQTGIAMVHETDWSKLTKEQKTTILLGQEPEKVITQDSRQINFDNYTTTDDHLMHVTGIATGDNGTRYYITKNSWGVNNKYDGKMYMSEAYVRLNTIAIMVHKDAVPEEIAKKLNIN
ncbi:MAG: C1 family peptidase [Bacteroidetes bacterium]|nr:C1 family peptidase [Bacteroidota bacterium]